MHVATMYKVVAHVEEADLQNGGMTIRAVTVREGCGRGQATDAASRAGREGFQLDSERGARYYPAHRIVYIDVFMESEETPAHGVRFTN